MLFRSFLIMFMFEFLSLLAFQFNFLMLPFLVLLGLVVFIFSYKYKDFGLYFLFGELFIGSRGHHFEYDLGIVSLSSRLVVFVAVISAWLLRTTIQFIESKKNPFNELQIPNKSKYLYGLFILVIIFGAVIGLRTGNNASHIFNDINGYLYWLAFIPLLTLLTSKRQLQNLLQIFAAAVILIALKTLVLFLYFVGGWAGVSTLYHWVITQDIGEITGVVGTASRIFMQSQFFSLMGIFVFFPLLFSFETWGFSRKQIWTVVSLASFSVIMSLSRSFWLGGIFALVFFAIFVYMKVRLNMVKIFKYSLVLLLIVVLQFGAIYGLTRILGGEISSTVASRTENPSSEAAGGARLLLLPKLLEEIKDQVFIGSGFGTLVAYKSFLPDRMTTENPDGEIENYAFEWGYLDIILKIGSLGFLVYMFFLSGIFNSGWKISRPDFPGQLAFGMLSGMVGLFVLNVTTPYLNHPLGIGYIILCTGSFYVLKQIQNEQAQS